MKKSGFILGMLALLLTFAFALTGCPTGGGGGGGGGGDGTTPINQGTAPTLTAFITLNETNAVAGRWTPKTTFAVNEAIEVGIRGRDPDKDVTKFILTFKRDGTVLGQDEMDYSGNTEQFTQFYGQFHMPAAGNHTVEVYALDSKGNQSNTLTADFTVN